MSGSAALASGGLDSAALIAHLGEHGPVHPLYVRADLPCEDQEVTALRAFCSALFRDGMPIEPVIELWVGGADLYGDHWSMSGSAPGYDEPDETVYLPGRNVMLIGLAAVWCASRGIEKIGLGTLAGNPFADATEDFFDGYARLLSSALGQRITVTAPFRHLGKADLVRRYAHLPLDLTLTCMAPRGGVHCDACNKCRERREAFAEAGVADGATYAAVPGREVA